MVVFACAWWWGEVLEFYRRRAYPRPYAIYEDFRSISFKIPLPPAVVLTYTPDIRGGPMAVIKKSGSYKGKSNELGHGGRAAQMRDAGVPGGVIGAIARREGAAPGGPNYHGKKAKKGK